jgi:hypothetical protein
VRYLRGCECSQSSTLDTLEPFQSIVSCYTFNLCCREQLSKVVFFGWMRVCRGFLIIRIQWFVYSTTRDCGTCVVFGGKQSISVFCCRQ